MTTAFETFLKHPAFFTCLLNIEEGGMSTSDLVKKSKLSITAVIKFVRFITDNNLAHREISGVKKLIYFSTELYEARQRLIMLMRAMGQNG